MEKKELKDLEKGIRIIKTRIQYLRNQYRDNVGAQFFLNLCEQGMPQIVDFMTRYAEQDYNVVLKENEQEALDQAAKATNLVARASDLKLGRNTINHVLNRRNFMIASTAAIGGATAYMWKAGKDEVGNMVEEGIRSRKLATRQKLDQTAANIVQASKSRGKIDETKLQSSISQHLTFAREDALKEEGSSEYTKKLFAYGVMGVALAAAGAYALIRVVGNSYEEAAQKKSHIIEDLEKFCQYKLDRCPTPASARAR